MILGSPILLIEGRIGHYEICFQILMAVVGEGISGIVAEIGRDATNGEIHLGEFIGGLGELLSVDRHIASVAVMILHEFH